MKKIFVLVSVLALAACGLSKNEVAENDALFAQYNCERIVKSASHLVYKCPVDLEWFATVKQNEPNALFMSGKGFDWDAVNSDTEHFLVEVVPGSEGCKENYHFRTMIRPINNDKEYYAFIGCK